VSAPPERGGEAERPFYAFLGVEVLETSDGRAAIRLPYRPELGNKRGDVHGGAIGSLLDIALSTAVRSALPEGSAAATISMTITYLQPGRGTLTGRGRVVRAGRTIVAAEGDVQDAQGDLAAHGIATFRVLEART
jgi:uncharacterized protein (TIGR00369 family)